MKHPFSTATGIALALAIPAWLATTPVSAQSKVNGGGDGGGGARSAPAPAAAPSAPSGGGGASAPASGGGGSAGGAGHAGGGGSRSGEGGAGGHRGGATGSSGGYSAPRTGRTAESGGSATAGSGAPRGSSGSGGSTVNNVPSGERGRRTGAEGSGRTENTPGSATAGSGVPVYSRPRDGGEPVGTAVPRGTTPQTGGGVGIFVPGGYYGPYGYGYYDPWGYGAGGYGFYGGYYDPWYGGYPAGPTVVQSTSADEGSLRLKIKPREAEVYVDGYYVGLVDDFDGIFQRLHLDSGPHRIEVRAAGYESLTFEVRITPEHTTTYQGELKKIQ